MREGGASRQSLLQSHGRASPSDASGGHFAGACLKDVGTRKDVNVLFFLVQESLTLSVSVGQIEANCPSTSILVGCPPIPKKG